MVKRIKTPEPGDDEPRFYTVVNPFPLHANWEYDQDYITCSRWVAGILGTEQPLYGIFHKPSARGQILLEIERSFDRQRIQDKLLGAHKWSEFLMKPSDEEKDRVSKIFYSTYSVGRDAQKDGWKRIHVHQHFFNNWSVKNMMIRNPYPNSTWCDVPQEDITNKPMCRYIPRPDELKPAVVKAPRPVVGSAQWVAGNKTAAPAIKITKLSANASVFKPGAVIPKSTPAPPPNAAPKSAWTRPMTVTAPPAGAVQGVPLTSPNAWASKPPANAWGPKPAGPVSPPGLPPRMSRETSGSGGSGASGGSGSSGSQPSTPVDQVQNQFTTVSISESQEAELYGGMVDIVHDEATAYIAEYEIGGYGDTYNYSAQDSKVVDNLWGEETQPAKPTDEVVCPVHTGKQCKKGICAAYGDALRKHEREKKEKEREERGLSGGSNAKRGNKQTRNGGNRGGNGTKRNVVVDSSGFSTVTKKTGSSRGGSSRGASEVDEEDPWG
ncbi:hypothetical protein C8J56DRAFT_932528 [Mycena floridula]|nr:hypothetical protein C8J56DRAFT_932528 [Mycena floridula]